MMSISTTSTISSTTTVSSPSSTVSSPASTISPPSTAVSCMPSIISSSIIICCSIIINASEICWLKVCNIRNSWINISKIYSINICNLSNFNFYVCVIKNQSIFLLNLNIIFIKYRILYNDILLIDSPFPVII